MSDTMETRYLVKIGQQIIGEFSFIEVQQQLRTGKINRLHRISSDGGQSWESANRVAEFQGGAEPSQDTQTPQPAEESEASADAAEPAATNPVAEEWYVTMSSGEQVGQKYGPFSKDEVAVWIQEGRVSADDLVWAPSLGDWKAVYLVFETAEPESAVENEKPGFLKTMFGTNVERQKEPKKVVPKEEQSWSIISIAALIFSIIWLGGLGSLAGIILALIGFFEVILSKGYKRGVLFCLGGFFLGAIGVGISAVLFFSV